MNFQPRRRLGILLMAVSVVFLFAALYALFFFIGGMDYFEPSLPEHARQRSQFMQQYERAQQYAHLAGPAVPSPRMYIWPYRWLSQPLAIAGIALLLTGLFVGYYDDIFQVF